MLVTLATRLVLAAPLVPALAALPAIARALGATSLSVASATVITWALICSELHPVLGHTQVLGLWPQGAAVRAQASLSGVCPLLGRKAARVTREGPLKVAVISSTRLSPWSAWGANS